MQSLLIIDDDEHMLTSLSDVLNQAGYVVQAASSGQQALQHAQTQTPDLVISDIRMAGMDGIECLTHLRAAQPQLKSIVITGYASEDTPTRAMEVESCDYLFKPFTSDQLLMSVQRALFTPPQDSLEHYPPEMRQTLQSMRNLESTRQRSLQNYYLGIRSGHLRSPAALAIWDHLETAEIRRSELEKNLQLRHQLPELLEDYLNVSEYCKRPNQPLIAEHQRKPGGVTRVAFQPFFNNIRDGKISSEQLKKAALARQQIQNEEIPPLEDYELYSLIWF